jgi:transaldolase/glucose-6-phosphate isomerase
MSRDAARSVLATKGPLAASLPHDLASAVRASLARAGRTGTVRRLWDGDASLWTGRDEASWLGWLRAVPRERERLAALEAFGREVGGGAFDAVLVLGMGGSSLCPEVWAKVFPQAPGRPRLLVLDSTDATQVAAMDARIRPDRTLYVVASKSGGTLEPNLFREHHRHLVERAVGREEAGRRFVAITDPGSSMHRLAVAEGWRHVFLGEPTVGGRYSALSVFGLVPAAAMGLDVGLLLDRAAEAAAASGPDAAPEDDPGLVLGTVLGVAARAGRDKVTLAGSRALAPFGAWLEQLVAESTGKAGKGLVPVAGEPLASPAAYGTDRVFVHLALDREADPDGDARLSALEEAGHPAVRIRLRDRHDLAAEMFRWEFATAVAGSLLGVNPFDQPDVEAAKVAARKWTDAFESGQVPPPESPRCAERGVALFARDEYARRIAPRGGRGDLAGWLRGHLAGLGEGDYLALLAFLPMAEETEAALQAIRTELFEAKRCATTVGFGPRYLHSTGQLHKGGPASGVYLLLTHDPQPDVALPGRRLTFGAVCAAQARGDLAVLDARDRRVVHVHLGSDAQEGLAILRSALRDATR